MPVDRNLFAHDVAVVAILRFEEPYVEEWLDYHLLAGVDHFYLYDNEEGDSQRRVLQPYVDRGIVTYTHFPGKGRQYEAYNDAVHRFRYQCRYAAFIDGDEFIYPQNGRTIPEVVDEVTGVFPHAVGLAVSWRVFGSSHHNVADYSRGVLERFTERAPDDDYGEEQCCVKSIVNPRTVDYFFTPHVPICFAARDLVDPNGKPVPMPGTVNPPLPCPLPCVPHPSFDKVAVNHYCFKSREEWRRKVRRGPGDFQHNFYPFIDEVNGGTGVRDDTIVAYRDGLKAKLLGAGDLSATETRRRLLEVFPRESESETASRISEAVSAALSSKKVGLETLLVCHAASVRLGLKDGADAALAALARLLATEEPTIDELFVLYKYLPRVLPCRSADSDAVCRAAVASMERVKDTIRRNLPLPSIVRLWKNVEEMMQWREFVEGVLDGAPSPTKEG